MSSLLGQHSFVWRRPFKTQSASTNLTLNQQHGERGLEDQVTQTAKLGRLEHDVEPIDGPENFTPGILRIPKEIRLQIYSHLLPDVPYVSVRPDPGSFSKNPSLYPSEQALREDDGRWHLSILRANKQIHAEASDLLYSSMALEIDVSERRILYRREEAVWGPYEECEAPLARLKQALRSFCKFRIVISPGFEPEKTLTGHGSTDTPQENRPNVVPSRETRNLKDQLNWIGHHLQLGNLRTNRGPQEITILYLNRSEDFIELEGGLRWLLGPITKLRNLRRAEIIFRGGPQDRSQQHASPRDSRRILDDVSAEMCSDKPTTEPEPLIYAWENLQAWLWKTEAGELCDDDMFGVLRYSDDMMYHAWQAYDQGDSEGLSQAVARIRKAFRTKFRPWKKEIKYLADPKRMSTPGLIPRRSLASMFVAHPELFIGDL